MNLPTRRRRRAAWALTLLCCLAVAASASDKSDKKDKEKEKAPPTQKVDSGAFGVFIKGQRVVTETFAIELKNGVSSAKAQLKETGSDAASQKSSMDITASGELLNYEWSQSAGGALTVVPANDFLLEKITTAANTKPAEQSFLMPSTSAILDNNFFIHRELLVWRYLAADCKPEAGNLKCQQGPAEFGVLVPQDRTSMSIRLELIGKEKVSIRGADRELLRLNLTGENFEWALWVDDKDQFKLLKVAIPADNTEVVRD